MSAYNVSLSEDWVIAASSYVTIPFNTLNIATSTEWNTGTYTLTPLIGLSSNIQYAIMGIVTFNAGDNWLVGETYGMQVVVAGVPYEISKTQTSDNTNECSIEINTVVNLAYGESLYVTAMHQSAASHTVPGNSNKANICTIS
jgi:hypothetical protein